MVISWLRLLRQRYLDITLSPAPDLHTRITEQPGLWMEDEELETLRANLRAVASHTLPAGDLTYGIFSDDRSVLDRVIITLIYDSKDERPIAFNALSLMECKLGQRTEQVMHLGLVMVDPNERHKGFSWILYGLTCFLLFLRNQFRAIWVSNVTQVPAIIGMVSETFSNVYPDPEHHTRQSLRHRLLARQIMAHKRATFGVGDNAGFDEVQAIITDAYKGGSDGLKKTYDQAPKHRNDIYNSYCADKLDYDRGDDILQLGQIDLSAAKSYLLHQVPRQSLIAVAGTAAFLILQKLILPALYWFDSSRQWRNLRPAHCSAAQETATEEKE